ncbi:MAG: protein jag [Anaerolineae bacterium]|nr:protein jag [Anaerolineae bacterium]
MVGSDEGVEVVGRTLDEAVQKGLEHLQLRRDQVDIQILSDGARTLLGFRPGQARVRVTPKRAPAPPRQHPRRAVEPTLASEAEKPPENEEEPEEPEELAPDQEADVAARLLQEMVRRMGIRARVQVELPTEDQPLRLNIVGRNLGILIGRRGETLSALQFLTRMMASHQLHKWINLIVDVDDYRKKREESLRRLAVRMAQMAVETGKVQELEPMPPAERRIVHIALRDFDGVRTESQGEDENRRVTIVPVRS